MPDEQPLTPEDQASLDAYETGEGNTEDPSADPKLRTLAERFKNSPALIEHENLIAIVHDLLAGETTQPVSLALNPGLVLLAEHLESKWAAHEGRPAKPAAEALSQIVSNHLHELLHRMTVEPTSHPYYGKLWDGLCEAEGLPGYRLAEGTAPERAGKGEEGPF